MNMRAYFLAGLGGPKSPYNRDFWPLRGLRGVNIVPQLGIKPRRRALIMVQAVQPDPKEVHDEDVQIMEDVGLLY